MRGKGRGHVIAFPFMPNGSPSAPMGFYWKRYCLTRADSPHQSLQISNTTKSLGLQMANLRGQQRDKPFRDALRMEIAAAGEDHKALREVARALLTKAASGDVHAIREIGDRMDGRVPQAVVGDDGSAPITLRTIVTGVRRAGDAPA